MGVALAALGVLLGAVLLVVVLAIITPLRLEMTVERDTVWRAEGAVRPFGRWGPRIPVSARRKVSKKTTKKKRTRGKKSPRWRAEPRRMGSAVLRLGGDVFHAIHLARLNVTARVGLGDPAETGALYGVLCPFIHAARPCDRAEIAIEPVFERAELTGRADVALSLVPGALIAPLARFGWALFGPGR